MDTAAPDFLAGAARAQAERLASGFAADGAPGGAYSERAPPPGMRFAGYAKGATGIVWAPADGGGRRRGGADVVARWLDAALAAVAAPSGTRCVLRRSSGLGGVFVALLAAEKDCDRDASALAARAVAELLERSASPRAAESRRAMNALAALIDRCPRALKKLARPPHAAFLAVVLAKADDADWNVRSAATLAFACVLRRFRAEDRDFEDGAPAGGVLEAFPGLDAALEPTYGPTGTFFALRLMARVGWGPANAPLLARDALGDADAHVRPAAALCLAAVAPRTPLLELLEPGPSPLDPNRAHGSLLACRALLERGGAGDGAARFVRPVLAPALWCPAVHLEAHALLVALGDGDAAAAAEARAAALARERFAERRVDALPGESRYVGALLAARTARSLAAGDAAGALGLLEAVDDARAVAVLDAATRALAGAGRDAAFDDDFDAADARAPAAARLFRDAAARPYEGDLAAFEAAAAAELAALPAGTSPARRVAALRFALAVAGRGGAVAVDPGLIANAWPDDSAAAALQIAAASDAAAARAAAEAAAVAAADRPGLPRRGAARALALLARRGPVSAAAAAAAAALAADDDPDVRRAAARALGDPGLSPAAALARYRRAHPEPPAGDRRAAAALARAGDDPAAILDEMIALALGAPRDDEARG